MDDHLETPCVVDISCCVFDFLFEMCVSTLFDSDNTEIENIHRHRITTTPESKVSSEHVPAPVT